MEGITPDIGRELRTGIPEVVYGEHKTANQVSGAITALLEGGATSVFGTRLVEDKYQAVKLEFQTIDYCRLSQTFVVGTPVRSSLKGSVGVICAGTSDYRIHKEVCRTLEYLGVNHSSYFDLGVAGISRLFDALHLICQHELLIVLAGMDGVLPNVVAGLVEKPVIAVPTSVGYGVSAGGQTALHTTLSSCSPGLVVVNIDNGFGAACFAFKVIKGID